MENRSPQTTPVLALLVFVLVGVSACKKLDNVEVPNTSPNPPVAALPSAQPTGSVIIGIPSPTPGSTPPPSSSPTASPGSSPTPTPSPNQATCNLAPMPDASPCRAESPSFQTQVEAAQAEVLRTRPDLFDGDRVRSEDTYVQEVARVLRTRGLCAAQGGPKDEVAVKITNASSDQYDIVLSNGQTWTNYEVTCRPARF